MSRPGLVGSVLAMALGIACKGDGKPETQVTTIDPKTGKSLTAPEPAPTPAVDPCGKAGHEGALPWIADDYPSALACAKQRQLPLVLDLWAPWCHTCLSMQSTVFVDPSLAGESKRFVFAALDTDRDVNAAVVAKFPPSAWPTFYVISPDEAVLARFVGSASLEQFRAFLVSGARARAGGADGADARLLGAERATTLKDYKTAEEELTAALAAAPEDWARRADALTSLISAKVKRRDHAGCLALAETSIASLGNSAAASDFLVTATGCAEELAKTEPARVATVRTLALAHWQKLLDDPKSPMSIDDRSDAMANMRGVLDQLERPTEALALAEKQRAMLDDAAGKAPTPMAAMTYNWPRAEVYVYLKKPLELVPVLEKSARALPKEYDPRARLGWIYLRAGNFAEAAKWTDEALALVYGPRKARLLGQRAEIAAKQNDRVAEKQYRTDAVKLWEAMPPGHASPDALDKAKQALAALDATAGSGSAKP